MFDPNDRRRPEMAIRYVLPRSPESSDRPAGTTRPIRRMRPRVRPNIVRLIPGVTRLPLAYGAR